jgi:hypothetical protein
MRRIKKFEQMFESFDGEAMYHSGAVTGNFARLQDYNNQNPAIELEEDNVDSDNSDSDEFRKWFKDSKIKENGKPMVVYHQTSDDAFNLISKDGFKNDFGKAILSDEQVPNGFFFKPTTTDISVGGSKQMPVYLSIQNPLILEDRDELKEYFINNIDNYERMLVMKRECDDFYEKKFNDVFNNMKRGEGTSKLDVVLSEWSLKIDDISKKCRDMIDEYLKNESYDGLIILKDEGSYKRFTKTFIALYPNQIKSVDNKGNFSLDNNSIFENYHTNLTDEEILQDIYTRVNKEEFNNWLEDNSSQSLNSIEEDDLFYELENFLDDEKNIRVVDSIIEFYKLWEDVENLIGDNPIKLYHFTSNKFIDSIKNNGLDMGHNKTNPYSNSYSGVYLTTETSGNVIDGYKNHIRQISNDSEVAMIEVKMYMNELTPDHDDSDISSGETQFISDRIEPNRILNIEEVY